MALILATHSTPLTIDGNYNDDLLGVLPEYRSSKSLAESLIDINVVKVVRDGNSVKITFNLNHLKTKTFTIDSSIFQTRTRFQCYVDNRGDFQVIPISDLIKDIASFGKLKSLKQTIGTPFAFIYFHDSATEGYVLINRTVVSNETFRIVDKNKAFTWQLLTDFPSVQSIIDADKNKNKVLSSLLEIDSIVALEQQVDLLTTLVKNLINNSSQPSWANDFLTKVEAQSVTTVKSASDIISDLDAQKTKIRTAQKDYLDNK
ncbi:hypothetical protein EB001_17610 [bacterium]|nr:hypothetical protein [bacterium]